MICKNCNKENVDGLKYCFYCGFKLNNVNDSNEGISEKRKFSDRRM